MISMLGKLRAKKVPKKWIRNPSDLEAIKEGCYFDHAAGKRVCDFIEKFCRQYKDDFANQLIVLMDWQRDFLMRLYGWKRANGRRRFKTAYLEIPKKNGKSTLESAQALYHLVGDKVSGPEVYVNAFDREQASIIYTNARLMVLQSPELNRRLKIIDSKRMIVYPDKNGFLRANSKEVGSKDGGSASFVIFDELHRQATPDMYGVYRYAGTSRAEPLQVDITTAGSDRTSICRQRHDHTVGVNNGTISDTTHLGVIYAADESDDPDSPATWRKANPSMGVAFSEEGFRDDWKRAKLSVMAWLDFLRYRLNIWCATEAHLISAQQWSACAAPDEWPGDDAFAGIPCYAGLDLSSTIDLTAMARIWPIGDGRVAVDCKFWIPEDQVEIRERRDQVPYREWIAAGWIKTTPGPRVDYDIIRSDINEIADVTPFEKLLSDPWNAQRLAMQLRSEDALPVEYIRQNFGSLSGPTKELEKLVVGKDIYHFGNPVLAWCIANAVAVTDAAGNIRLSKKHSREKIDGAAALVNAIAGYVGLEPTPESGAG